MKVKVAISNRHIHLTEEAYNMLFTRKMTKKNDISQKGEFAANETLTIEWGDKKIENVRIVGPYRKYNTSSPWELSERIPFCPYPIL